MLKLFRTFKLLVLVLLVVVVLVLLVLVVALVVTLGLLAGLRTLGGLWSAAAGGVSMLVLALVILISSMAKMPLILWAWISCNALVVRLVVGDSGLKRRNSP